ncbi:uncharacterized protein DS421_7g202160 [Arachis hypogaea]|nr:uncharacterized protein DS421_7g202160 [Arachis hypogaea]
MANSMAYISFLFLFRFSIILLLFSHVLTHELFKENTTMNVDWYNPSAGKKSHVFRKRKDPFSFVVLGWSIPSLGLAVMLRKSRLFSRDSRRIKSMPLLHSGLLHQLINKR